MRRSTFLLPVAALAVSAMACSAPAGPAARAAGGEAASGQPKPGGVMNLRIANDPFDWDLSYVGKSIPNGDGMSFAYNSLLGYKTGPDLKFSDLILRPELAETWDASKDGKSFTFHLRKGVKFAGKDPVKGRDLTSADVKWSFEYWSRTGAFKDKKLPAGQFGWMFEGVESIDASDPLAVTVRFSDGFAPFLSYVASDYNPVVPHEIYDRDGHLKNLAVGSGPFQLDESASQKGSRWVFKKNPTYWEPGKPYLDEVRWLVIPDDSTALAAFRTKQIDLVGGGSTRLSTQQAQDVQTGAPTARLFEYVDPAPMHFYLNARKKPLDDIRVRRAIAFAIDPDEFIKVLYGGKGQWAMAGAFPDTFTQDEIHKIMKRDPAESKKLLADAGFASGLDLEFIYPGTAYGESYLTSMQLLQAQLKKAGINLQLKSLDKADESERKKNNDFVTTHTSKSLDSDVDSYLFNVFHPSSKANYGGTNDPQLADLLVAQRRETDPKKRLEFIRAAALRIYDQAHALALYEGSQFQFWYPYLKNYAPNFGTQGWPLTEAWVDGR